MARTRAELLEELIQVEQEYAEWLSALSKKFHKILNVEEPGEEVRRYFTERAKIRQSQQEAKREALLKQIAEAPLFLDGDAK